MAELLLEIFSEEIPARMQVRAAEDFSKMMTDGLTKAGLTVEDAKVFSGPRRLTFVAEVPLRSPDVSEERKGPRVGSPDRAIEGFLRGAGLSDVSDAEIHSDPKKGEYYVAILNSAGRNTTEIVSELVPDIMGTFPWPKSMKSGSSSFRWVRPLQGIICLLDGAVVPFEVGGIKSGDMTEGHRKHGKGPFKIKDFDSYVKSLEGEGHVVLSHDQRKELIIEQARKACADKGLELVEDEGLLSEVAGLAEWPVVILGDMDPSFLELPGEVIRLSMRMHQKYFAVRDPKSGELAPNFIVVANQDAPDGGKAIAAGNSRVLSARLADAKFFQSEDAKKPLADYYDKLDTVVFHKKLGTIKDKAERVAALARELAPKVGADPDEAEAAAKLAKNDLVTQMVIEFTSLEGQIGRLMYEREGGDPDIAVAIEDHYKPKGPSDEVPTNPVAVAVALADKLDTLVGFWAIDEKPTGSKDPFALRRAALGLVRLTLENGVRLSLHIFAIKAMDKMFDRIRKVSSDINDLYNHHVEMATDKLESFDRKAFFLDLSSRFDSDFIGHFRQMMIFEPSNYRRRVNTSFDDEYRDFQVEALVTFSFLSRKLNKTEAHYQELLNMSEPINFLTSMRLEFEDVLKDLLAFIADRLKVYLRDQGIRHDLIDAVFALGEDDLVAIVNRVKALQSFLDTKEGEDLLAGYKRAANILKAEAKKGELPEGAPNRPDDPHGAALFDALQTASPQISSALEEENFEKAMLSLAELRAPIDAFFTEVQVISSDSAVKENNLRLLGLIRDTARQIADFEAING